MPANAINASANVPQSKFLAMPHKFRAFVAGLWLRLGVSIVVPSCKLRCRIVGDRPAG